MAPLSADTAPSSQKQKQARRPLPRIVPAIPHRLSRAPPSARPITPEESNKGAAVAPQQEPEPKTAVEEKQVDEQPADQHARSGETPLTPDSRASINDADTPVLGASPATSHDDHVEHGADAQDVTIKGQPTQDPTPPSAYRPEIKADVNGVHRKLAVPAELPPPFYPSSTSRTDIHTPPADGSDQAHAPYHRHRLSAGAVVFQSANASPVISATPQETESNVHIEQQTVPRPPPGFAPAQYTPFFQGHSQHPSEATAPWLQPPYSAAPMDPTNETSGAFRSPTFSNGPIADPSAFNGHFPSRDAAFITNGTGTPHPQSPSKSQFGETKLASDRGEDQHAVMYQNSTAPPAERLEESPFELAAYLSTQFGNPQFADFILQVRSPESILVSIPVHGIIVVRSVVVADAVRRSPTPSHRSRDARRPIDILALDPFVTRESIEEAVKVLYGAPLLSAQTFLYGLAPYLYDSDQAVPSNEARRRMQQVLSYIAAARTLHIPSMQARGVEIARMLLRWDTIDQVLHYALQASSASRSSKDDPFTNALLNYAIEFMAYIFPVDFSLYTIAPELKDAPRLPTLVEPRPPTHNPRLSKIRFGDAPPEDDFQASHATRVLSTILLSLPVPLLERLFNHRATANQIGWTGTVRTMQNVINERENRRQKALRGQLQPSVDGTISPALLGNMYIEERVEQVEPSPLHPSGHRLATQHLAGEA
ncbi:uncharacterized protein K460DRAFT_389214 [Cucurbitaria berberidis CBS 394.84]|uniref:Uncharacterized protein n=1 Tax=Cucurbitaria berberidis CBS 394.84 TaxID=1168544 RepID=A0A9P4GBQ6_9PLEO|nr:uncharacterized protein K460DRAFT_389214 [Cucurbitaria berberidis CBS 394.84]KAF1842611.1 hypothetical protein K460DRAFT_389214 [Cucurbitaria berberidis CBS 394.84]